MNCSGQRIKAVRILRGMTLKDVADKIGVQEATIQRYESGQIKSIPQERLLALSDALDTSTEYLLGIGPKNNHERGADQFVEWILSPSATSGSNIKKQRESLGIDISKLAASIGVSRQTIYRYEAGKADNVSPRILGKLAKALETNIAYVLGKTDDPNDISPSALSIQDLFTVWAREESNIYEESESSHHDVLASRKDAEKRLLDVARKICLTTPERGITYPEGEKVIGPLNAMRMDVITDFVESNEKYLRVLLNAADEAQWQSGGKPGESTVTDLDVDIFSADDK